LGWGIIEGLKMTEEYPKDNSDCNNDKHNEHLCYFVSYGYHCTNEEEYNAMIVDPKFKCYFCGRVAHCAENLCKPVKL